MRTIYADNAATTRLSDKALADMSPYLLGEYGNPSSIHPLGQIAKDAVTEARKKIAACINANPWEILFTASGSESDNQAIVSALSVYPHRKGIVTTPFEHPAVHETLRAIKRMDRYGIQGRYRIQEVPVYYNGGVVDAKLLEEFVSEDTALVSVMAVNNEIGTIQPIAEIGEICKKEKIPFHVDAVQAAGHIPIDVKEWGVDYLSMSAHKFGGPKGVGILYVRDGCPVRSLIYGGGQEFGKRAGTENVPGIVGAASALKESCDSMRVNTNDYKDLYFELLYALRNVEGMHVNGNRINAVYNIVNLGFTGVKGSNLAFLLAQDGIFVSTGSACSSGSEKPSRTLVAIGKMPVEALESIRISFGPNNTKHDVREIGEAIARCVKAVRENKTK